MWNYSNSYFYPSNRQLVSLLLLSFGVGFYFGTSIFNEWSLESIVFDEEPQNQRKIDTQEQKSHDPHVHDDSEVLKELKNDVKVICWILNDHLANNATPAIETWGKRCTKLIVLSTSATENFGNTEFMKVEDGQSPWLRTKMAFKYIYEKYFNEADWFLKADDETYVIMENLRHFLYPFDPNFPIYFGCRLKSTNPKDTVQGYMDKGAGYVLSKEALKRFIEEALTDPSKCNQDNGGFEDINMGNCLANVGVVAGDARDAEGKNRFLPYKLTEHMFLEKKEHINTWYKGNSFYPIKKGLDCCSHSGISFHRVGKNHMYGLEYMIYHLKPYGIEPEWELGVQKMSISQMEEKFKLIKHKNVTYYTSNDTSSDKIDLYQEVRVLCWIMTNPKNHKIKAIHVLKTWGKRCNKILFMSSAKDDVLDAVALPVEEGRGHLWEKTKEAFKYIYKNHLNDADWFLKADDDTYVIVENLRTFLYPFDANFPIYFGCKIKSKEKSHQFMSGGAGYVLSKAAMKKFIEEAIPNKTKCEISQDKTAEDVTLGKCLEQVGVTLGDARDKNGRSRFLPFSPADHLTPYHNVKDNWYYRRSFYRTTEGRNCCSESGISFHYIDPKMMYVMDYLIYDLKPQENLLKSSQLKRKMTLEEMKKKFKT
ncbi:glycoprotein-N-acetylgalactosamine 3-beta-galactosyltransferase 1-like [Culicoides brevitarsis]|uniref:glycoprotein-N-acetylgalactosamine 3-beta-galactosyltransferase 1-like n=1 Tax=Culicoides brevitarsis TaxID=469753 RepID=UPI00307CB4B0